MQANNISANRIRDDFLRRQQESSAQPSSAGGTSQEESEELQETKAQQNKRKNEEEKALKKIKKGKQAKRRKKMAPESDGDDDVLWDVYKKSNPLPGQLENCEICEKRFTVTGYSKTGPDGGLLCSKCSKDVEAGNKKDKLKKNAATRSRRRQAQSNLLDGIVQTGAKTLLDICVEKVADNINDVEEFGDLPTALLVRLSQILSKRRILTSRTLDLFLRADNDFIFIYDCAKLEKEDFQKIFAIMPSVKTVDFRCAGQLRDEVLSYIIDRKVPIEYLCIHAANLISDEAWQRLFINYGPSLQALRLSWLDCALGDASVKILSQTCRDLKRLSLKKCFKLGNESIEAISSMKNLEHLSLLFKQPVTLEALVRMVKATGKGLQTLSLIEFPNADNTLLQMIHETCHCLNKLRLTDNDLYTDKGFVDLFVNWSNLPLTFIDLSSNRHIDNNNPDGPEEPVGLASDGLRALMAHSGRKLERLNISSCRHISHEALLDVFDGIKQYENLRDVNINFTKADDTVVAGIFRSCPRLKKVEVFGCFNVRDVRVPPGIALIGVPNAQNPLVIDGNIVGVRAGIEG
ncbi:MAG: hypothetical protein M1834_006396 [Cirrosporium novae-zelandiae]|nr:MAG: hypothetical protein M1834_006396 [Cirrosporium novae-zelandiae]